MEIDVDIKDIEQYETIVNALITACEALERIHDGHTQPDRYAKSVLADIYKDIQEVKNE